MEYSNRNIVEMLANQCESRLADMQKQLDLFIDKAEKRIEDAYREGARSAYALGYADGRKADA